MVWTNTTKYCCCFPKREYKIGDFVNVKVTDCTKATLIGEAIGKSNNN